MKTGCWCYLTSYIAKVFFTQWIIHVKQGADIHVSSHLVLFYPYLQLLFTQILSQSSPLSLISLIPDHLQPCPANHSHLLVRALGQEPPPGQVLKYWIKCCWPCRWWWSTSTWTTSPSHTTLSYQAQPKQRKYVIIILNRNEQCWKSSTSVYKFGN